MTLGELSRGAIESAIKEYDTLGRDEFLTKYGFGRATGYALEHNGRSYDPKAVAGVAFGYDHPDSGALASSEFNGGAETNRALQRAGFQIRRISQNVGLQTRIEEFLASYLDARKQQFGGPHPIRDLMASLVDAFQDSSPLQERPTVTVRGSIGQGNWAAAPWIAFLDKRETSTTQHGVYAVLLFREDMSGAYMTLAQGTTDLAREGGRHFMRQRLNATADRIRPLVDDNLTAAGFSPDNTLQLGEHNLARNYEASTIVHKLYARDAIPDDAEILHDLDAVLDLFDRYFQGRPSPRMANERADSDDIDPRVSELIHLLQEHHNIVLEGVPGTGKSHAMEEIAGAWRAVTGRSLVDFGQQPFAATVMHPSTSYEDFIEGLRPTVPPTTETARFDSPAHGDGEFKVGDGFFLSACVAALGSPDRDVLVLLDELNRCNIPSVLGDLLLTLESSKRARFSERLKDWHIPVAVTLPYSGRSFFVPSNVYVVATTNTTDRSVAPIDAAIRRRFAFVRLEPDFAAVSELIAGLHKSTNTLASTTLTQLVALNDQVLGPCLGPDAVLGQSYAYSLASRLESFAGPDARTAVIEVWRYSILPQLIDSVRSFGAEDLLTASTRDRWFADHGSETDGADIQARSALNELDNWLANLGLAIRVEGTGLSRGARVHLAASRTSARHVDTTTARVDLQVEESEEDQHAP